ncbi:2-dehydro-3-deoxyphosphogluconate aldolase, partial [Mesorhizobium tamadayense]
MSTPFDTIARIGVVPVITIERVKDALPLADALLAGGLPVAEITFRSPAAADVLARLAAERPDLIA